MADQTSHTPDCAAQSRWNDDDQPTMLSRDGDADNSIGDRNLTDAEILLRDWCGEE